MREVILEIGAEGGSLTLYGIRGSDRLRKYYLFKNSADFPPPLITGI